MSAREAVTRLESIRRVGVLGVLWGSFMSGMHFFILGAGEPVRTRIGRDPVFIGSALFLVIIAFGIISTTTAALNGHRSARSILRWTFALVCCYGIGACAMFIIVYAAGRRPHESLMISVVTIAMTAALLALARRARQMLDDAVARLLGSF